MHGHEAGGAAEYAGSWGEDMALLRRGVRQACAWARRHKMMEMQLLLFGEKYYEKGYSRRELRGRGGELYDISTIASLSHV